MTVTAVLVAHDGAAWLPEALAALSAQTVPPQSVVLVDTGSTDGSAELLTSYGAPVLHLPAETGYGAAVAAGLGAAPAQAWVWLLHDDCAPEPEALQRLLEYAGECPSAVLLGPKVRDWADPRVLVEVGVTVDAVGHRETGLERREYDQGQHDGARDVLAVGTAGALVRRDVWDLLGGLEPLLPLFRDELDLGWRVNAAGGRVVVVPAAGVRHVRAATTGRRARGAVRGRPERVDRAHALFVLLAHAGRLALPLVLARLVVSALLRTAGFLLTRQPGAAADELAALLAVLARPGPLRRARRVRAATRTVERPVVAALLASRTHRLRARAAAVGDWLTGGAPPGAAPAGALGDAGPEGPEALADLAAPGLGAWRRLLLRPSVLLPLGLALVALVAERRVLATSGGVLHGGRLLPPPAGAADLWHAYAASWHPSLTGSAVPAPPSLAVLGAASSVLLGKPWLAVDLLLLASVPLAGATAHHAAAQVVRHPALRLWAAATWALLPVATGAVAAGRLDAAAVQVALPLLGARAARLLGAGQPADRWRRAWGLGLALAVVTALAPLLWPVAAAALLLLAATRTATGTALRHRDGAAAVRLPGRSGRRSGWRSAAAWPALVAVAVPPVLLLPWTVAAVREPALLLHGPGPLPADPGVTVTGLPAWHLLLLSPGGVGLPAPVVLLGLLLAGLAGLVRSRRYALALAGWVVALIGLAAALLLTRLPVPPAGGGRPVPVWPGVPLQVAAAGLLLAALVAADGARAALSRRDFGFGQVGAVLVAAAAAAAPVVAAATWLAAGVCGPLHRHDPALLPAFARAELAAVPSARVLVLRPDGDTVRYELAGPGRDQLGAAETPPAGRQRAALDAVVADLLTPSGSDAGAALATRAVRYVAVPAAAPGAADLGAALDAQQALTRRSTGAALLWQVASPAGRLTLLPPATAAAATRGDRSAGPLDRPGATAGEPLPVGPGAVLRTPLAAGPPGQLVVLAEAADPGWRASLDGRPLPRRTAWGWAQAFVLPPAGGLLEVRREEGPRQRALLLQGGALLVLLVLSAPPRRRRRDVGPEQDDA